MTPPFSGQFPANRAKSLPGERTHPRVPIAPNYGRMKGTPTIGKRSGESATNRTSQWSEWVGAQLCADEPSDWRRAQSIFGVVFGGAKAACILGPAIGEMDGHEVGRNMMRKLWVLGFCAEHCLLALEGQFPAQSGACGEIARKMPTSKSRENWLFSLNWLCVTIKSPPDHAGDADLAAFSSGIPTPA